ncbi:hypothetical protein NM688_g8537 [Phlebia brevispora]|uniref:Uncharacterized protein n=1 Tax=Phlebia brevispora TaxID=194682 RepID=A0ACC1RSD9_9APHY|nr:hypothetical protein NM688_g8537 [Phlebia brevispora]
MSAKRWGDIVYSHVPALCMKQNTEHFFKHDPERFETYLEAVESGKKRISGATLMPHELLRQAVELYTEMSMFPTSDGPSRNRVRRKVAETQLRTIELQWKTLVERLRGYGTLDNALAICDVSGSMGYLGYKYPRGQVQPLLPALALSIVTAQIAKPPFANCFITFSRRPQFIQLDPSRTLGELAQDIVHAHCGMDTNLHAVFMDLLLPLAIQNKVKQEDMIKRLFIFSDMQFNAAQTAQFPLMGQPLPHPVDWETNHDAIEKAFREAGYELPEIVYWDLAGAHGTAPVTHNKEGVALMSGFSPAMMKAFMEDTTEDANAMEIETDWEVVGETVAVAAAEAPAARLTPLDVMKNVLSKTSYDGLVVTD